MLLRLPPCDLHAELRALSYVLTPEFFPAVAARAVPDWFFNRRHRKAYISLRGYLLDADTPQADRKLKLIAKGLKLSPVADPSPGELTSVLNALQRCHVARELRRIARDTEQGIAEAVDPDAAHAAALQAAKALDVLRKGVDNAL